MSLESFTLLDLKVQRPLCIALAHRLANIQPGDPRNAVAGRLYLRLSHADKLRCHAEMLECRKAKRGDTVATLR